MRERALLGGLMFEGKTNRCMRPSVDYTNLFLDHTKNHWQSTASLKAHLTWLDGVVYCGSPRPNWILFFDGAQCAHFSRGLKVLAFVPANGTEDAEPCDMAAVRPFGAAVCNEVARHFACVVCWLGDDEIFDVEYNDDKLNLVSCAGLQ